MGTVHYLDFKEDGKMESRNLRLIADYFIALANTTGDPITNLKLQKMVYYAQAWFYAINDRVLFDEDFESWVHGPVLPALYKDYRHFKWNPISRDDLDENSFNQIKIQLGSEVSDFLDELCGEYFGLSGYDLERLTHMEDPWIIARGGCSPDDSCKNIITKESMRDYYRRRLYQ